MAFAMLYLIVMDTFLDFDSLLPPLLAPRDIVYLIDTLP